MRSLYPDSYVFSLSCCVLILFISLYLSLLSFIMGCLVSLLQLLSTVSSPFSTSCPPSRSLQLWGSCSSPSHTVFIVAGMTYLRQNADSIPADVIRHERASKREWRERERERGERQRQRPTHTHTYTQREREREKERERERRRIRSRRRVNLVALTFLSFSLQFFLFTGRSVLMDEFGNVKLLIRDTGMRGSASPCVSGPV